MTTRPLVVRSSGRQPMRRVVREWSYRATRAMREAELTWLVVLIALTLAGLLMTVIFRDSWPLSAYVLPLLIAMNVMSLGKLLVLDAVTAVCLLVSLSLIHVTVLRLVGVLVTCIAATIVTLHTRSRTRLGLQAIRGDSMLVDLRDRLGVQSQLPALPRPWHVEAVIEPAGGASFSGDFVVAAKARDESLLELAVVDVSGKGLDAGTRSLQLSGAFGGLLGSLPPRDFLPTANEYLLRQEWVEGFATAIHVSVDLRTGSFEVRTAGHPPAVQFHAGSGRWTVHWTEGPLLGIVGAATYAEYRGQLHAGDALLLYTDGVVESRNRDIVVGIDKLVGKAERLVQHGFQGGAARLVVRSSAEHDDRALVLLHRQ